MERVLLLALPRQHLGMMRCFDMDATYVQLPLASIRICWEPVVDIIRHQCMT